MNNYHRFKEGELVWCYLYPGVYEVVDVKNREKEKGGPYSDLLILKIKHAVYRNHSPVEKLDELHCEKLEVGIEQYLDHLKEVTSKLKEYIKYNEKV